MKPYRVPGNMKIPFFLTPDKHYVGRAWYRKSVCVPSEWNGREISLFLERPHIKSSVWINGNYVGSDSSLSVPHVFRLTPFVKAGSDNKITICIDNDPTLVGVGQDSHSVTDQTQGCWNGIVGRMELVASSEKFRIEHIDAYPDLEKRGVELKMILRGNGKARKLSLKAIASLYGTPVASSEVNMPFTLRRGWSSGDTISVFMPLGEKTMLWDEFSPAVYSLSVADGNSDIASAVFGMREIKTQGRDILVNGNVTMMRGTVENCNFPLTGYPPADEAEWTRVLSICKKYGINHVRFHSYCPPEAAFTVADRLGIYLQPEGPSWPNHGVSLGRGEKIDTYLMQETQRMVSAYGNHPSFAMLAAGNEPRGNWVRWCSDFVDYWRRTDKRRIYTGASVGGGWQWQPKNEYHVKAGLRGLEWNNRQPSATDNYTEAMKTFYDKATKTTFSIDQPFIAHEAGQWCAFPDLKETSQYTGVYKAKNFEVFADLMKSNNMADMADKFLYSSGKLQALCYKFEVEKFRRTPHYAGYQMLALNDYSGQGTALVGMLNVFFREKGYADSAFVATFNRPVAIMAEIPKFTYSRSENFAFNILLSDFTPEKKKYRIGIAIRDGKGNVVYTSETSNQPGILEKCGNVNLPVESLCKEGAYKGRSDKFILVLSVEDNDGTLVASNFYDFWIYPDVEESELSDKDILVTDTIDEKAIRTLKRGGKVLVLAAGKVRYGKDVKQTYLPVFWNTSWFKMRPPHTTGAYIDTTHHIFDFFATDNWTNLNWWELVNNAQTMQITEFPEDFKPIFQPIDTWHVSRKLAMLFEANVLGGKLIMTSFDISADLDKRIVARQLRKSIINYMNSDYFQPMNVLSVDAIQNIFTKDAPVLDMYTKDSPDELKPKIQ